MMKIRNKFVSNSSSSSSFVLDKDGMTEEQMNELRELIDEAERESDDTCIFESGRHFHGRLSMHNTTITAFLRENNLQADIEM